MRPRRGAASELGLRVATAAVGIPLVLGVNYVGGMTFAAFVGLAAAIGAFEFCQLVRAAGYRPAYIIVLPAAVVCAALPLAVHQPQRAWVGIVVGLCMVLGVYYLSPHVYEDGLVGWTTSATGVVYTGLLLGQLALLRTIGRGAWWVVVVLIMTWAYDTGAYFTGRAFGSRKFMPYVSPNKTVEGVLGGLVASTLVGLVAVPAVGLRPWQAVLLGLCAGVAAQAGDLVQSMVKRKSGVKDSGVLFPGHGGLLDRIDSLLFAGAVTYYAAAAFGYA